MPDSPLDVGALQALGVEPSQAMVYRLLVGLPPMSAGDVAIAAYVSERQATRALAALESVGLVTRTAARPPRFTPALPSAAIEALVLRREEGLQRARLLSSKLDGLFRQASDRRGVDDLVEILRGRPAIARRFLQLRAAAREEIAAFDTPPYATDSHLSGAQETSELGRGIRMRAIYDGSALAVPGAMEHLRHMVLLGEESRTLPSVPMKLAIIDRRTALVPLRMGEPDEGAIVVHESPLLDALATLFELMWERADPLPFGPDVAPGETSHPNTVDRQIVVLLAGGHKDESIAHALNLTERTVRRRVHAMLVELGIRTRFQLGRAATLRSWLSRGEL